MSPEDCTIGKLVSLAPAPKDFILGGWEGLTPRGGPDANFGQFQDVMPFMPLSSPKIFNAINRETNLGRAIHSFLEDHPNYALQIGVFFPAMWDPESQGPFWLVMGRPSKASDAVVGDIHPINQSTQKIQDICKAQAQGAKDQIINALTEEALTPLAQEQIFHVAQMQRFGWGTARNHPRALERLAILSRNDHAAASFCVGNMHYMGQTHAPNPEFYYKVAALQGHPEAQVRVGMNYLAHQEDGYYPEALRYLTLAADQGHPEAQFNLGTLHGDLSGEVNDVISFQYYQQAADQDHTEAQFSVGKMYQSRKGTAQNLPEALRYFQLVADKDHREAQFCVGEIYAKALGVAQDFREAFRYCKLSADQGYREAQYKLATLYDGGTGTAENIAEAFKFYRLAANQGHAESQFQVGALYAKGEGAPEDLGEAFRFYRLAASQGHVKAQAILNLLKQVDRRS